MKNDYWTNAEVAVELDCEEEDVELLGEDLDVPDDEWMDEDVDAADALLDDMN
jgi:hypothetical protein